MSCINFESNSGQGSIVQGRNQGQSEVKRFLRRLHSGQPRRDQAPRLPNYEGQSQVQGRSQGH